MIYTILLNDVIEGHVVGNIGRGRRGIQMLDNLKGETRRYWYMKEEAADRARWSLKFKDQVQQFLKSEILWMVSK